VNRVFFSDEAVRLFLLIPRSQRTKIKDGIRLHLVEGDPAQTSRNKFRLRRPSEHAEFELRLGDWRVFYRIRGDVIEVVLLGEKCGDTLIVGGEEFHL
jgi:mRNA-degrading endonuclease RelE of RelBE toxin-antitoxin system